ncbi:hypothetical protein, partial [Terrabacter terrae]|uniref:hypothetical protein n=1 Tax=Terrabacter terrae TaxID=318434 RepID=UPI0031D4A9FA
STSGASSASSGARSRTPDAVAGALLLGTVLVGAVLVGAVLVGAAATEGTTAVEVGSACRAGDRVLVVMAPASRRWRVVPIGVDPEQARSGP